MIISGLTPNKGVVKVIHGGSRITYHSILLSLNGYIRKCEAEGKTATYIGVADSNGRIEIN